MLCCDVLFRPARIMLFIRESKKQEFKRAKYRYSDTVKAP